jgi:hypothetical protein
MEPILKIFKKNRQNIIKLLHEHKLKEVNAIPFNFNNNIIWNAGHILLSQQFLLYYFSDLPMMDFVKDFTPKYASNSKPKGEVSQNELDLIIDLLESSANQLITDYDRGIFKTYKEYTSDYFGITMRNIEEAIHFNTYHEGYHFGFMRALEIGLK